MRTRFVILREDEEGEWYVERELRANETPYQARYEIEQMAIKPRAYEIMSRTHAWQRFRRAMEEEAFSAEPVP